MTWRTVFVVLSLAAFAIAAWIWWRVPDTARPATSGLAAQWAGVVRVFQAPRFWWIGPLGGFGMGSFMAVQGLWSVPWLIEVNGYDRATAARHLLAMSCVILAGYVILGLFATRLARRGIHARHLFAGGFALAGVALGGIVLQLPGTYLWWSLYGFGAAVNILAYTVVNDGFAKELVGRANTALNLLMFMGSFLTQWGVGVVVDAVRVTAGRGTSEGLQIAFALVLLLHGLTYAWFALGWRRYAHPPAHRIGS